VPALTSKSGETGEEAGVRGGRRGRLGVRKQRADGLRGGVATFALHHLSTVLNPSTPSL
jgi:hypothetical protein